MFYLWVLEACDLHVVYSNIFLFFLCVLLATRRVKMKTSNSEFFNYDDLTCPEVAALPRDVPLVIPLGTGYDDEQLAQALSYPVRIGLLPAFPFGWRGSGLELPKIILGRYVGNRLFYKRAKVA